MRWKKAEEKYWLTLERGEEVGAGLLQFCRETGVQTGTITAIGALQATELGYLDVRSGEYLRRSFPEEMELLSFLGNISLVDGIPLLHAHVMLSGSDYMVRGGHFFQGTVAVTFEAQVDPFAEPVSRTLDEVTGLKLLSL